MESRTDLGFLEEVADEELFKLKSKYFPSKVGGKPAWLALTKLPLTEQLKCEICSEPLLFLLQIYCPFEDKPTSFHRTLFVFCCVHKKCGKFFKAFRSQLQRNNHFYNSEPPDYEAVEDDLNYDPKPDTFGTLLCSVCGCSGDKFCSACKQVSYCSREHQSFDWKRNGHKEYCGKIEPNAVASKLLIKEFELVIENEDSNDEKKNSKTEEQRIQECVDFINERNPSCQNENLDEYEKECMKDAIFDNFKKKTKHNADQVIRYYSYDRHNGLMEPLWINNEKPTSIPNCENCGSVRKIECQIMPQLLYFIDGTEKSVDFGTLLIYTCINSCEAMNENSSYIQEFVFTQNFK